MTATLSPTRRRQRGASGRKPSTTYPKGRRCALGQCGCERPAILSKYNPDATCSVCTPKLDQEVRRAEPLHG